MCMSFAELFFVVYSTTDRTSFREAALLVRYIQQDKSVGVNAIIILVATKSDLKHSRQVEEYEGRFLANDLNCEFCELSNSEGYSETHELLTGALRRCINKSDEKNKPSALSRVKEGLVETAKSLRRNPFSQEGVAPSAEKPKSRRAGSCSEEVLVSVKEPPLRKKSASHDNLILEENNYRSSIASTASL